MSAYPIPSLLAFAIPLRAPFSANAVALDDACFVIERATGSRHSHPFP